MYKIYISEYPVLSTDYECPWCGKNQSVAQMGGFGGRCIQCNKSSNPKTAEEEALCTLF